MKKRVLSMLLAFILCFSTLPMTAFAQEADAVTEQEEQQEAYEVAASRTNSMFQKLNGVYKQACPYEYLAKDGVIEYNGIVFACDTENNAISLGDVSDKSKVITVRLSGGGTL